MALSSPAGLALLALAIPVLLLHVLRPQRQAVEVSSTYLWRSVAQPTSAARPWQRLRVSALLVLQLLVVALLALAAAQPVREQESTLFDHTVFIVDASGSMLAADGEPDRLADAVERARRLRREVPEGGTASVVVASTSPQVLLNASPSEDDFAQALAGIDASAGHADFGAAFALAASLETADAPTGFVLVSDGGLTDLERDQLLPDTTYASVGDRATNRAITRLAVEPRGSGLHVLVVVANTGGESATQQLRVDVDERTVARRDITVERGATVDVSFDVPAGDRVEAFLEGEDLLDADDHAFATAARRRALDVVVVAADPDPFLVGLLEVMEGVAVEVVAPDAGSPDAGSPDAGSPDAGRTPPEVDVVIYDRVPVPAEPDAPFLALAPPGGVPGSVQVDGEVEVPAITLVQGDDPLLEGLDLTEVAVGIAQRIDAPAGQVLVGAEAAPLVVRGLHDEAPYAYLAFGLSDSNLPLDVAYPVLFDRLLTELAGAALPPSGLVVGDTLPVDPSATTRIGRPGGTAITLAPGTVAPVADRPGFWTVTTEGRPARVVAVNADPVESHLAPAPSLPTEVRVTSAARPPSRVADPWLWPVVALALMALVGEWWLARRSRGVPAGQWRVATAARVAVAALLLAALVDPVVTRSSPEVATVFLVDGSASVGATGRAEAVAFVDQALGDAPEGARSAVVLFGGDARLERILGHHDSLADLTVAVDATHTDLAAALRLGGAVLPEDARRRVVLVSDGRATRGDAAAEAQRLRDRGIAVDVVVVDSDPGADVAVSGVDVPGRATAGETVEVTATVEATSPGPVTVTLLRDGEVVEERAVEVAAEGTEVRFAVEVTGAGLERYQVRVAGPANTVTENDLGYAAVEVTGPDRVLVVAGHEGVADHLATVLDEASLALDVVAPEEIPPLDELSTYAAVVLVDVDARSLAGAQVDTLAGAVRDLGRGLVVVGGERSYALGGYFGSDLEALLPVISEIQDPERRRTVAEVMAIDTSGSMGACHCADGTGPTGGQRGPEGGVNKTDIARSAAARAVEALNENDEVGILAFNVSEHWVVPLQQLPAEDVVLDGLQSLQPRGGTDVSDSLATAAEALRSSKASLRHIILFSDGFTDSGDLEGLAEEAAGLAEEGITVSVIATGEGAADLLEPIAESGRGRFYPGRDLQEIPQIMLEETFIASRNFVNEGEFLPAVSSTAEVVEDLREAPVLAGYLATTPRPTATVHLRVGEYADPLLASWRVGLGRTTAWTSDAGSRWAAGWTGWDGEVEFWSRVVRDVFPTAGGPGAVRARVEDGVLRVTAEGVEPWPDGSQAQARVARPDGTSVEVPLDRVDGSTFAGEVAVDEAGTYAVGAEVTGPGGVLLADRALTSLSYSAEFRPGASDEAALARISELSGGRGEIGPEGAFDEAELAPGRRALSLAGWLLLAAALLWPVAVALSRLALRGSAMDVTHGATAGVRRMAATSARRLRAWLPASPSRAGRTGGGAPGTTGRPGTASGSPGAEPGVGIPVEPSYRRAEPTPAERPAGQADGVPPETVGRLLERKRQHREES